MNIKDKVIICCLILLVISVGIFLEADATPLGVTYDRDLADMAANDKEGFINAEINDSWFEPMKLFISGGGYNATIAQSSATCLYEQQGADYGENGNYKVLNVINMNFNTEKNDYQVYGWWANNNKLGGQNFINVTGTEKLTEVSAFCNALYEASQKGNTFSGGHYISTEKSAMKTLFYKAIEKGGFLWEDNGTADGILNIDRSFIQEQNGESLNYSLNTSYTAGDLINDYRENAAVGYGLTNMVPSELGNTVEKQISEDKNYVIYGPFNIHMAKPIEKITIKKGGEEKTIDGICFSESLTEGWSTDLSQIPSEKNFYIKVPDNNQELNNDSSNINIIFYQKNITTYKARIVLLKVEKGEGQNLIVYAAVPNNYYAPSITYIVNQSKPADLIVEKRNEEDSINQADVNFILNIDNQNLYAKCSQDPTDENGVNVYSADNITFSEWTDESQPYVFKTGKSGRFKITGINSGNTYALQETYNSNAGYTGIVDIDTNRTKLSNNVASIKITQTEAYKEAVGDGYENLITNISLNSKQDNLLHIVDKKEPASETFDINIKKTDSGGVNTLDGAIFKIKVYSDSSDKSCIGWLKKTSSGYDYEANYEDAEEWKTDKGLISIKNLNKEYHYSIYETKTATGYTLSSQKQGNGMKVLVNGSRYDNINIGYNSVELEKYSKTKEADLVFCGRYTYKQYKTRLNIVVTNVKGNPGPRDDPDTKTTTISGRIWEDSNTNSKNYDNIYGTGDKPISDATVNLMKDGSRVKSTTTNAEGKYEFTGIEESNISDYYIELVYNGIGEQYQICKAGTTENSSRAKYQSKGKAWTDNIEYSYREHVNIGLISRGTGGQRIEKDVAYVRAKIKGNEYTYYYGAQNNGKGGLSKVSLEAKSYHRTIYASDIAYSKQDNVRDGLEVYITYIITVTNSTTLYESGIGGKREQYLTASVTDEYDTNYYTLIKENGWSGSNGQATQNVKCERGSSKNLYITFKLTDNAINKILDDGEISPGNHVKMEGKHYYKVYEVTKYRYETYYVWGVQHKRRVPVYGWVDYDKEFDKMQNNAPGMTFSIYEYDGDIPTNKLAQRRISGKVFEDKVTNKTNGQKLGDGVYSNDENLVKDVKVDLIDAENNNVATRYVYDKKLSEESGTDVSHKLEGNNATVKTEYKGNYEFIGILPGKYYIRFTYGDGTQYIYAPTDLDSTNNDGKEKVTAYEYKSTIIKDYTIQQLLKGKNNSLNWYRNRSKYSLYSLAVDNLVDRETLYQNKSKTMNIIANTPKLELKLENDDKGEAKIDPTKYNITDINFGIVQNPKIELGLELNMTNVKVTNAQGNVIIEGNPGKDKEGQNLKYLSNLDKKKHMTPGSTYAKIEISDKEIYGSKLEITYAITIRNNSDLNYYEDKNSGIYGYYYMFGEIDNNKSKQVGIQIEQVQAYLDTLLKNSSTNIDLNDIKDWNVIYTDKYAQNKDQSTSTIKFTAYRNLSNKEEKTDYNNQAMVTSMKTVGNQLVENVSNYPDTVLKNNLIDNKELVNNFGSDSISYMNYFKYEYQGTLKDNPTEIVNLTIVPPTGIRKIIEYIIITITLGIVIIVGIILIKKKIL